MNRVQLVQVIVIVVAVMLGYNSLYYLAFCITNLLSTLIANNSLADVYTISNGLLALLFIVLLLVILNNTSKLSMWIVEKIQPDENIKLNFTDKSIIYGVLLFLTLGSLLRNIPFILYQVFEIFKSGAGAKSAEYTGDMYSRSDYPKWIETIIAFILLIKVKAVVNYLHSKIDPEDPHAILHTADDEDTQHEEEI
jgi:hypothetical protein